MSPVFQMRFILIATLSQHQTGMGKTKRGKGTKLMAVADGAGFPVALSVRSASPHEVRLVEETLNKRLVEEKLERLIGNRAYDSDPLDKKLAAQGILLNAPHKGNHKKPKKQNGRAPHRYRRRRKVEHLFTWLQNHRRSLMRYDRFLENYIAFIHLACIINFVRNYY
jgi:transposase